MMAPSSWPACKWCVQLLDTSGKGPCYKKSEHCPFAHSIKSTERTNSLGENNQNGIEGEGAAMAWAAMAQARGGMPWWYRGRGGRKRTHNWAAAIATEWMGRSASHGHGKQYATGGQDTGRRVVVWWAGAPSGLKESGNSAGDWVAVRALPIWLHGGSFVCLPWRACS